MAEKGKTAKREKPTQKKHMGNCGHELRRALIVRVKGRSKFVWICWDCPLERHLKYD